MVMERKIRTAKQQEIVSRLVDTFGIDGSRILFLNPRDESDPWIPASQLEIIARQIEGYRNSKVSHDKYIRETEQHLYLATVVDTQGREFTRSGAATVGEAPIEGEEFDAHALAAGRALSAALKAAGFHPCEIDFGRESENQSISQAERPQNLAIDEATRRHNDLGVIHILAKEKNLWVGNDDTRYREELFKNFGVRTAAVLNITERAAVKNWLQNYKDESFLNNVPAEYREDALMA